mmetsp:Transcript_25598/g.63344  ORF Transcript_25598/g.63344 Transcript_25598/m.63344 type:complete len:96 (-) Transcript_25598:98-385(-)
MIVHNCCLPCAQALIKPKHGWSKQQLCRKSNMSSVDDEFPRRPGSMFLGAYAPCAIGFGDIRQTSMLLQTPKRKHSKKAITQFDFPYTTCRSAEL